MLRLLALLMICGMATVAQAYDQRWPDYGVSQVERGSSGGTSYFQGFESPCFGPPYQPGAGEIDWVRYYSEVVRVPSGSSSIPSRNGFNHAELVPPLPTAPGTNTGAYTRLGGYRSNFGGGYTVELDVYFDLGDPRVLSGINADYGWDATSAINDQSGEHRRDFIFHAASNTSGQILVGTSNTSSFAPVTNLAAGPHATISSTDWYTLQWVFRDAGDGTLAVDMNLLDGSGVTAFSQTLNDPSDVIASVIGGNRYLWFVFVQSPRIAVDNVRLNSAVREALFASMPTPGAALNAGSAVLGASAPGVALEVQNQGSLRLEICSCAITGPDAADFSVATCPTLVAPDTNQLLNISCMPSAARLRSANLTLVTNDSRRGTDFNYPLLCTGIDPNAVNLGVPVPGPQRGALWLLLAAMLLAGILAIRSR